MNSVINVTNKKTVEFADIAAKAGFDLSTTELVADQETADRLALAAREIVGEWKMGDPPNNLMLTGDGPPWAYLAIGHALQGRVSNLYFGDGSGDDATIKVFGRT